MHRYAVLLVLLLLPFESFASWGEDQDHLHQDHSHDLHHHDIPQFSQSRHIHPKHVYALASLLQQELESIRYIMGVEKINHALFQVKNAAPREVYFQAVNLYGKTNRLHHNLTARSILDHDLPAVPKDIKPADVWDILFAVLVQIDEIQEEYSITSHAAFPQVEKNKTPTDVYQSLLLIIRQVNQMLQEEPYTHSDVYQETSTALYCLLNIYTSFPGLQMQKQPALQPGKKAEDVFNELINTYQTIRHLIQLSGFNMLELSTRSSSDLQPGDIYELAVLITSELKFLHSHLAPEKMVHTAAYPGVKFPSHVLQRLTYLHNHLQAILRQVKKNPHWLAGPQQ